MVVGVMNIKESEQLKRTHPQHGVVDRVNENLGGGRGCYIGLLMAYPIIESWLSSRLLYFFPAPTSLALRCSRFKVGKIRRVDFIYINAAMTVQMLVDMFEIKGMVNYGIAGSANDCSSLGDVSIPRYLAFPGSWNWKLYTSASSGQTMQEVFGLPVEPTWFSLASRIKDVELVGCADQAYCLAEVPAVVYGLRCFTAHIFLDNAAYRQSLFTQFNVSTVDEESSAVVMAAITNGVPCIEKWRSSTAAAGYPTSLAAVNVLTVAAHFIGLLGSGNHPFHLDG
ncbi:hypothetical protein NMG60_11019979 [Bertholletia excelsa]